MSLAVASQLRRTHAAWADRRAAAFFERDARALQIEAEHKAGRDHRAEVLAEVATVADDLAAQPLDVFTPDRIIRAAAARRARVAGERLAGLVMSENTDEAAAKREDAAALRYVNEVCQAMQGGPVNVPPNAVDVVAHAVARARCPLWWRRQLRRAVAQGRERLANLAGEVGTGRGQAYVTDDTMKRRIERAEATRQLMESTELENEAGQVRTLAELAGDEKTRKRNRRAEVMTRISGCEALADAAGHVGVFLTLTAPSRFHAVTFEGKRNPKHAEWRSGGDCGPPLPPSPRDAQRWLSAAWARVRADLARQGVRPYGIRVAEPHADGCPHWHALLWVENMAQLRALRHTVRRHWLADAGDERGAARYRVTFKTMHRGGAAGYVAKYVAKAIDDAGQVEREGHHDGARQVEGGTAARVEAWASAWRIRQFQFIGQPPVTVWRELRRTRASALDGASDAIRSAHEAVNREGGRRADWAAYVLAQGGLMRGRDYRIKLAQSHEFRAGAYGEILAARPVGVRDALDARGLVIESERQEWRAVGGWKDKAEALAPANPHAAYVMTDGGIAPNAKHDEWAMLRALDEFAERAKPALPRTRVDNCTQAARRVIERRAGIENTEATGGLLWSSENARNRRNHGRHAPSQRGNVLHQRATSLRSARGSGPEPGICRGRVRPGS